jgi:hypothetical protein
LVSANAAVTAAETATAAVATYTAAAAETAAAADDTAAAALATTAVTQATAAAASVTSATAEVAVDRTAQTFTLTAAADAKTTSAGNDSFTSLVTTLNTGDNIDGGAGDDNLTLTASLTANVAVLGFSTANVENFYFNVIDANAAAAHTVTANMLNSAPTTVILSGSTATTQADGLVMTNLDSTSSLSLAGTANMDATVGYKAAYLAGAGDTATLFANGVSSTAITDSTITYGAGIESLTVNSTGTASSIGSVVWGGAGLTVTGDANLTIGSTLAATATNIDASTFSGKLSVIAGAVGAGASAAVADITVQGGTGNDTLNVAAVVALRELAVNGGDGDDNITIGAVLAGATAVTLGDVLVGGDGIDTLTYTSGGFGGLTAGAGTLTTGVSGFESIAVSDPLANTIALAAIQAGISDVKLVGASNGGTITGPAGSLTVSQKVAGTGAITLTDTGTAATDSVTLTNASSAVAPVDVYAAQNIVSTGYETVTVNTTTGGAATTQDVGTITITGDTGATVTTVNFTGSQVATVGVITATDIDASGLTSVGAFNTFVMGGAAVGIKTITGSEGRDTLIGDTSSTINGGGGNDTITGGATNDVLNGGDGNDGITTNGGSDAVNGGAGNDVITLAGNLSAADAIDGGDGTDTMSVTNASITTLKAFTLTQANAFNTALTSVETLTVTDALVQTTFDLGYLGGVNRVNLAAAAGITGDQALNGLTSGFTIDLQATLGGTDVLTAGVTGAAASSADALTVVLSEAATTDYVSIAVADVETLTIDVSQTTANATVHPATLGIASTATSTAAGGSGAAQTVNIIGTESLTIDVAVAADTIDASGMSARTAATAGLTMGAAFTATAAIPGQTITGSGGVDTLRTSTGTDTVVGGAGVDTIHGSAGGDSLDGGTGSDVYVTAATQVAANVGGAGTGTSTGVVINLGATALTNAAVLSTTGANLSGGKTSVATGEVAYLFGASLTTNASTVDTLTSIENITLAGNGANYVVGSATANTITGGTGVDTIVAGNGADRIIGGGGLDVVTLTESAANSAVDTVVLGVAAADAITMTGFTTTKDKLEVTIATFDGAVTGTPFATIGAGATAGAEYASVANAAALASGSVAGATNAQGILHLQDTGAVYINTDGVTAGGLLLIGNVGVNSTLAATDFNLV